MNSTIGPDVRRAEEPPSCLKLWGGIECTINRLGDTFVDQFEASGHYLRPDDLDRVASLGIRTLRYPLLWEHVAPDGALLEANWSWIDTQMGHLRRLGIEPIIGLVHHGSGPRDTSLLDPAFPERLADFAGAVARRYPWVTQFTPINEPLTTARFSGLYGHWFPHGTDEGTFARCLMTEIRATVLAMRAIRAVTPDARLIQTEDIGQTHSTPLLSYQAEFENERRWATYDLLCGRIRDSSHRLWGHFTGVGIPEDTLCFIADNPCPPNVLGVNYYVTSERFLDERIHHYPEHTHGSNGRHLYADVEAVRTLPDGPTGIGSLLREAWERYNLPIAVTEAHLGCTREEQLRWLMDVWRQAQAVRETGADIRAVTAWSLFGAFDWDSLLTRPQGHYESGVFDLRGRPEPRETALGSLCRELASGTIPSHPVLNAPGWWQRPEKCLTYKSVSTELPKSKASRLLRETVAEAPTRARPVLITGGQGVLADALVRLCEERGLPCQVTKRSELDIASQESVESALAKYKPWAVINAAGFSSVDAAEIEEFRCFRENTKGPVVLASACQRHGLPLLLFSSANVFDGKKQSASYGESDATHPLNVYGRSKESMETRVLQQMPEGALIIRSGPLFGPWDSTNFIIRALRQIAQGLPVRVTDDLLTPSYLPDFGHAALDLLIDGTEGIWHLGHPEAMRRSDIVRRVARFAGLDEGLVQSLKVEAAGAVKPQGSALVSERTRPLLPPLEGALRHFVSCTAQQWDILAPAAHADLIRV